MRGRCAEVCGGARKVRGGAQKVRGRCAEVRTFRGLQFGLPRGLRQSPRHARATSDGQAEDERPEDERPEDQWPEDERF